MPGYYIQPNSDFTPCHPNPWDCCYAPTSIRCNPSPQNFHANSHTVMVALHPMSISCLLFPLMCLPDQAISRRRSIWTTNATINHTILPICQNSSTNKDMGPPLPFDVSPYTHHRHKRTPSHDEYCEARLSIYNS